MFNPFGTEAYDAFLPLEEKLIPKLLEYAVAAVGGEEFMRQLEDATPEKAPEEVAMTIAPPQALYVAMAARDPKGRTLWDRWASDGWVGLNNDERLLAECHSRSFVAMLEIQKVMDDHRTLCMDFLDPKGGTFLVFDRQVAKQARFSRFLAWVCPLPNFVRPVGMPIRVDYHFVPDLVRSAERCLAEDRKEHPEWMTLRDWLFYNLPEVIEWLDEEARDRRNAILSNMDLHQCVATYRIVASRPEIEAIFRNKVDFEPIEAIEQAPFPKPLTSFTWLRRGESQALEKQMPAAFRHDNPEEEGWGILANVRVYEDRVQIDTLHKRNFKFAKKMLPKYFGARLKVMDETVVDLAKLVRDDLESSEQVERDRLGPCYLVEFARHRYKGDLAELFRQTAGMHEETLTVPGPATAMFCWSRGEDEPPIFLSMDQDHVLMLCLTEDSALFVREEIPNLFGNALRFLSERVENPGWLSDPTLDGAEDPIVDPGSSAQPALTDEQKQILLRVHENGYRKFLDDHVPWLDGHTPREAARDPVLRPKLVDLMKLHINGLEGRRRREGLSLDIDWVLDELGLSELK